MESSYIIPPALDERSTLAQKAKSKKQMLAVDGKRPQYVPNRGLWDNINGAKMSFSSVDLYDKSPSLASFRFVSQVILPPYTELKARSAQLRARSTATEKTTPSTTRKEHGILQKTLST